MFVFFIQATFPFFFWKSDRTRKKKIKREDALQGATGYVVDDEACHSLVALQLRYHLVELMVTTCCWSRIFEDGSRNRLLEPR